MAVVVIGGQASGVGKTGAICALIQAMPERRWTAIKIAQCSHRSGGKECDCELDGQSFAISEEHDPAANTDTSRYLAAGAVRSLWVRTLPGHLGEAMPRIEEEIRRGSVLIESNSVMEFLRPDVYAMVAALDGAEFKPTALKYLERVDAVLAATARTEHRAEEEMWPSELQLMPRFSMDAQMISPEFTGFVRSRIDPRS